MSDGISSVNELQIHITAETAKFADGIKVSRDMLKSFVGDSIPLVGSLDQVLAKLGATAEGLPGKMGAILSRINPILGAVSGMWDLAKSAAEKLGVDEDVTKAGASFSNLFNTIKEAGLAGVGLALPSNAVGDLTSKLAEGEGAAKDWSEAVQDAARDVIKGLQEAADLLEASIASNYKKPEQLTDKQLPLAIAATKTAMADLEMSGNVLFRNMEAAGTGFGDVVRDNGAAVEALRSKLEGLNDEASKRGWTNIEVSQEQFADITTYTEALEKQTIGLRIQVETFGMAGSAAKAYAEKRQLLHDTGELPINPDELAEFNEHLKTNLTLRQQLEGKQQRKRDVDDDNAADEKAEADAERAAEAREKAIARLTTQGEKEVHGIQAKTAALGQSTEASQVAAFQDKLLYDLKQKGIELTADERAELVRLTADYAQAARAQSEAQRALSAITATTGAMSHSIENAFSNWTTSGEFNVKKMVSGMLADLAKLTLQMTVLQPLFGGGSTPGGGILGGLFGGLFNGGSFGGFFADGGDVNGGIPIIVGERGPELFVPPGSGSIVPNHALSGRGDTHISLSIDARGATPDAVAMLEGRIPGLVMQTVQDAQQRGAL